MTRMSSELWQETETICRCPICRELARWMILRAVQLRGALEKTRSPVRMRTLTTELRTLVQVRETMELASLRAAVGGENGTQM